MSDLPIRPFSSEADVRRVGEGLLDGSLPAADWTHEAHLAACLWLILERPDIAPERDLPGIISRFNLAKGGVNSDTGGYHETLTQLYIRGVRQFAAGLPQGGLLDHVNALLVSAVAPRNWPFGFYSREVLFSVAARKGWVGPDLAEI